MQVKLEAGAQATKELEFRRKPVAFRGEMMFTSMLLALHKPKPFKAYFLQGHGEPSLADTGNFGYLKFGSILAQNYIAVTNLELLGDNARADGLQPAHHRRAHGDVVRHWNCKRLTNTSRKADGCWRCSIIASIERPTGLEPILQRWGVNVVADW